MPVSESRRSSRVWSSLGLSLKEKRNLLRSLPSVRSVRELNYHATRAFYGPLRGAMAGLLARLAPVPDSTRADPALLEELRDRGFAHVDICSPETARALFEELKDVPCRDPHRPHLGVLQSNALPSETHVAQLERGPLIRSERALALANHPQILALVSGYLGAKPTALISAWWSVAAGGVAEHAELFHRDKDDWRFIKLFVYLSDVDMESGPHVFVPTSHRHQGVEFRRQRRYSDDEVTQVFPKEKIEVFTGQAGTAILEDTYGLHKGQPVLRGRRLMFQVTYSLFPLMYAPAEPEVGASDLSVSYDPHVLRVHVDPAR